MRGIRLEPRTSYVVLELFVEKIGVWMNVSRKQMVAPMPCVRTSCARAGWCLVTPKSFLYRF